MADYSGISYADEPWCPDDKDGKSLRYFLAFFAGA
jgi:hypothetical protein